MVAVIIGSRKVGINPDNVATPIAASLGDLVTLYLLARVSSMFFCHRGQRQFFFFPQKSETQFKYCNSVMGVM